MRDYSKVAPSFWTGETGKRIKSIGLEAQVVALHLVTGPQASALGLYYLPVLFIAHETGIPFEGASKALRSLSEGGFCGYDEDAEVVWVYEMARFQIGESLSPKDNRVKWVNDEYAKLPKCRFLQEFFEKYGARYHIEIPRNHKPLRSPSKAPSKTLRSQEQEQEQERDQDQEVEEGSTATNSEYLEPEHLFPDEIEVLRIPCIGGYDFAITQQHVEEFQAAFPGMDVGAELKRFRIWCVTNPTKRKQHLGVLSSINSWLSHEQDKIRREDKEANGARAPDHKPKATTVFQERMQQSEEMARMILASEGKLNAGQEPDPQGIGQTQPALRLEKGAG